MPNGKSLRYSVFLLKPEVADYVSAIDPEYRSELQQAPLLEDVVLECQPAFFWQRKRKSQLPKWYPLLTPTFELPAEQLFSSNMSGILFLTVNARKFAVTFHYGHNFLSEDAKVRDFGLKAALGAIDEEAIRDMEFSTPEAHPFQTKKQTGRGGGAFGFGISDVYDIIKFASGRTSVEAGGLGSSSVGGNDALKFNSQCTLAELAEKCAVALRIYTEQWYRRKGFEFIDFIRQEKDPAVITALDDILCRAFIADPALLLLAPPEITHDDLVTGYRFTRTPRSTRYDELLVEDYMATHADVRDITIEKLKSDKVIVCYSDDGGEDWPTWSVYRSIILEAGYNGFQYVLFEGAWYNIDLRFQRSVEDYYRARRVDVDFPACNPGNGDRQVYEPEAAYNARVAEDRSFVLLDRVLVGSEVGYHEACDLLANDGTMYHVKRKHAGLSHLFRQGDFSSHMLAANSQFRSGTVSAIRERNEDFPVHFSEQNAPTGLTVHFVILAEPLHRGEEFDMPFFAKVAFKMAGEKIESRQHRARISFVRQLLTQVGTGEDEAAEEVA